MLKLKNTFLRNIIHVRLGLLMLSAERNSLILDAYLSIGALNPIDHDNAISLIGGVTNGLFLLKNKHTRLIIV